MAKKADLMGLGVPYAQANIQATEPTTASVFGITFASAFQVGGQQYLISAFSGTAGSFIQLPAVGGFTGCLLGDDFIINNQIGSTLVVCAASGVFFSIANASITGTTGFSMSNHRTATFYSLSSTAWLGISN